MGVFHNECRLPTLGSNLNDIKLEGGEDGGEFIKKHKASWMHARSKSSDLEIALSPNCFIKSRIFFQMNKCYKATDIILFKIACSFPSGVIV